MVPSQAAGFSPRTQASSLVEGYLGGDTENKRGFGLGRRLDNRIVRHRTLGRISFKPQVNKLMGELSLQ